MCDIVTPSQSQGTLNNEILLNVDSVIIIPEKLPIDEGSQKDFTIPDGENIEGNPLDDILKNPNISFAPETVASETSDILSDEVRDISTVKPNIELKCIEAQGAQVEHGFNEGTSKDANDKNTCNDDVRESNNSEGINKDEMNRVVFIPKDRPVSADIQNNFFAKTESNNKKSNRKSHLLFLFGNSL